MKFVVPTLVALIGAIIYMTAPDTQARILEAGRIMFWTGLLVTLFHLAGVVVGTPN